MTKKRLAEIHKELGNVYFKNGEFEKAGEEYLKAEVEERFQKIKEFNVKGLIKKKLPILKKLHKEKCKILEEINDISYEIYRIHDWARENGHEGLKRFSYEKWKECDIHDFEYEYE